jgi:hypothetical protein
MTTATITEVRRGSAHTRQVDLVRASLLRGIEYRGKAPRRAVSAAARGYRAA